VKATFSDQIPTRSKSLIFVSVVNSRVGLTHFVVAVKKTYGKVVNSSYVTVAALMERNGVHGRTMARDIALTGRGFKSNGLRYALLHLPDD
jgi:hypothetical protein